MIDEGACLNLFSKRLVSLLFTALCFAIAIPHAAADAPVRQAGNLGVGIGNGTSASGLSLKYFLTESQALQATAGFGYGFGSGFGGGWLGVGADYLFELPEFFTSEVVNLGANIGAGAGLGVGSDLYLGVSGIGGLEFNFVPIPIDLVFEWRPTLNVLSGGGLLSLFGFGGHLRYYF